MALKHSGNPQTMNISINKDYIGKVIGNETFEMFITVSNVQATILTYILPWLATITVVTNIVVCVLCLGIYTKTKKKNHKPAFVFIGFLALIDFLLGM